MLNAGTIDLVLNDAPYAVPASVGVPNFTFDQCSQKPALNYRPLTVLGGTPIARMNSRICTLTGLSTLALNPESIIGNPLGTQGNAGGRDNFYNQTGIGSDKVIITTKHPKGVGDFTPVFQSFLITGIVFDKLTPSFVCFANGGVGTSDAGLLYANASPDINFSAVLTASGLVKSSAFVIDNYNQVDLWAGAYYTQVAMGYRNYGFFSAGVFRDDPGYFSYDLRDGLTHAFMSTPVFPVAALQSAFVTGNYVISSYYKGFTFVFDTNGGGPTGGRFEVVLVAADFSYMALVNLIPGSPSARIALQRPTAVQWAVKVDTDGTLYFNSGHALDQEAVWISGPGPTTNNLVTNAFALPCYTPCFPGPIGEDET